MVIFRRPLFNIFILSVLLIVFIKIFFPENLYTFPYNLSSYEQGQKINEEFKVVKKKIRNKNNKNTFIVKSIINKEKAILNIYVNDNFNKDKTNHMDSNNKLSHGYKLANSIKPDESIELNIEEGDILRLKAEVTKPEPNRNPGLFNYRDYLHSQYVFSILNIKKSDIVYHKKSKVKKLSSHRLIFSNYIEKSLDVILDEKNSELMKSVILGDTDYMEEDRLEKIRELGIAHILAVSGFHIGIIYLFCMKILNSLMKFHKRKSQVFSLSVIFLYIYLIGFPVSAMRAFLMISILVISQLLQKRTDPLNTVGAVGLLILVFRPLYIMSLSFQLSFSGVISILVLSSKISKAKLNKLSINSIIASFIGLFPISIYYFNKYSLVNIISNILISFTFTASVVSTIINLIIYSISNSLGVLLSQIPNTLNSFMNGIITFLEPDLMYFKSPSFIEFFVIYIGILAFFKIINLDVFPKIFVEILFISMIISSTVFALIVKDENTYIRFIDVGQGDSAWIEHDKKTYLIDTGDSKYDAGNMILKPLFVKNGISEIDGIVISHFDSDHAGGIVPLIESFKVKKIYIGHSPKENEIYRDIIKSANRFGTEIIEVRNGKNSVIPLSNNNYIQLIPPSDRLINSKNENDSSLAAILNANRRRVLFTGDIEKSGELELMKKMKLISKTSIDILKVPHHGSKTSSSEEFLDTINPEIAVIQCGKNNFGHPSEEILKRYFDRGIRVFRNDVDGWIELTIDNKGVIKWLRFLNQETEFVQFVMKNREGLIIMILYILMSTLTVNMLSDVYKVEKYYNLNNKF